MKGLSDGVDKHQYLVLSCDALEKQKKELEAKLKGVEVMIFFKQKDINQNLKEFNLEQERYEASSQQDDSINDYLEKFSPLKF